MKSTCKHSACSNTLNYNNKSGFCWEHRTGALRGEPRKRRDLAGLAECPVEGCGTRLYSNNTTGFCGDHNGRMRWERLHGVAPLCTYPGCGAELRRRNKTLLCRRHGAPVFARKAYLAKYNISEVQFVKMLGNQANECAICLTPLVGDRFTHLDHDHRCCPESARSCGGCIRGILCHGCNVGIGSMGDSARRLRAAADYLDLHSRSTRGG